MILNFESGTPHITYFFINRKGLRGEGGGSDCCLNFEFFDSLWFLLIFNYVPKSFRFIRSEVCFKFVLVLQDQNLQNVM